MRRAPACCVAAQNASPGPPGDPNGSKTLLSIRNRQACGWSLTETFASASLPAFAVLPRRGDMMRPTTHTRRRARRQLAAVCLSLLALLAIAASSVAAVPGNGRAWELVTPADVEAAVPPSDSF